MPQPLRLVHDETAPLGCPQEAHVTFDHPSPGAPTAPSVSAPVRAGLRRAARRWPWLVAEGVLGIVAGVVAIIYPHVTVIVLAVLLGIGLVLQGVLEVMAAAGSAAGTRGRVWLGIFGVITAVAGLICLIHPGAGVFAIILGLTFWFALAGVNDLSMAFSRTENRTWNLVLGVLGIVAAVVLIVQPGLAIHTVAIIAGITFIVRGILDVGLGLLLRRSPLAR